MDKLHVNLDLMLTSMRQTNKHSFPMSQHCRSCLCASCWIQTNDPRLRRSLLYSTELKMQKWCFTSRWYCAFVLEKTSKRLYLVGTSRILIWLENFKTGIIYGTLSRDLLLLWEWRDSNPLSHSAADLQSAPVRHLWSIPPLYRQWDSNPHGRNAQGILSPLCLPFHHVGTHLWLKNQ